jgi:hypothetical protein
MRSLANWDLALDIDFGGKILGQSWNVNWNQSGMSRDFAQLCPSMNWPALKMGPEVSSPGR